MNHPNPKKPKRRLGQWKAPTFCLGCECTDSFHTAMRPSCQIIQGEEIHYETEKWHCTACGAEWLSPAQATAGVIKAVEQFQMKHGMLTGSQMRDKRRLLKWTQDDLAERSGVSIASIKRSESGVHVLSKLHNDAVASTLDNAISEWISVYKVLVDSTDFASPEFSIPSGWTDDSWSQPDPWNDPFEDGDLISTAADSNELALAV